MVRITSLLLFFGFCLGLRAQGLSPNDFQPTINRVMEKERIPGLAIAVLIDGKLVYESGFGIRRLGTTERVDAHTVFQAASITKVLTALVMGKLVEHGKLKWSDRVIKHLPKLALSDSYVTENLTIADLLAFRCGILEGDALLGTRKEILSKLPNLRVTNSFRAVQGSFNLGYTLAGLLEEQIFLQPYEMIVSQELLAPLGMSESHVYLDAARKVSNRATPHIEVEGKVSPTEWTDFEQYAPAACLISNVHDLSKLAELILNRGIVKGKPLLRPSTLTTMERPAAIMDDFWKPLLNPKAEFMATGLGFLVSDYRGYKLVEMDGAAAGSSNTMTLIPSAKLGVIIQANKDMVFDGLVEIKFKILDQLLALK